MATEKESKKARKKERKEGREEGRKKEMSKQKESECWQLLVLSLSSVLYSFRDSHVDGFSMFEARLSQDRCAADAAYRST